MKLPVIKQLTQFIEDNDADYLVETIEVLENLTEVSSLKDEELDVIGELISNMYGALEVNKLTKDQNMNVFWESEKVKIEIFDAGKEDGDIINLYNGSKVVLSNYKVTKEKKVITLDINSNNLEIKFEAISEGTIAPNTAKIILIDKNRTFELMTNLNKSDKASITFIKKDANN